MANPFVSNDFEAELQSKAGTKLPGDLGESENCDSFTEIDPSMFMKSSLGDHQAIIGNIKDAQKRAEASKDFMSESKVTFIKYITNKKITAVQLDEEIAKLSAPVDGEDFLRNLERVLKENSSRTKVVDGLRAVEIMRKRIVDGNDLKRTLKKGSVLKVRKFADELDRQPQEPQSKAPSAEEQTELMIHFTSEEMKKIEGKFKALSKELALIKEKIESTHKAQIGVIEYVKKIDAVVSSQIMPEVYRRHKFNHQSRDYTKYWALWNDRETKLQSEFAKKFAFENVPAVFGQMLLDAQQYDCTTEINQDTEYKEHRKIWDSYLADQEQYYKTWSEEYVKLKTESNYSYIQKEMIELQARLKKVTEERDIANNTVIEKVKTIETLEQQMRNQIEAVNSTQATLDTEKATAGQLQEELKRILGLNTSQATLIKTLTEERDSLKKSLEKEQVNAASELAKCQQSFTASIADLKKKYEFAQKEIESLNEINVEGHQCKKELTDRITQFEANIKEGQAQLGLMNLRVTELEGELKKLRDEHQKLGSQYEVKCQAYERLKTKYGGD